jgi:hypothetical protein
VDFNKHFELAGKHAFLSASKYAWIRYDDEKLEDVFRNHQAAQLGSELHDFASRAIKLGIRLPRTAKTLNAFVNDALGYRMASEQILYFSDNVFGTADAISFRKERGSDSMMLRIHDLKNGVNKASMDQLLVYAALFCLEYGVRPGEIDIELRIYQNDEIIFEIPDLDDIVHIMSTIKRFDARINQLKVEALG